MIKDYKADQAKYRDKLKPKLYPKGTIVPDTKHPDGSLSHYPNDARLGGHNNYKDRSKSKKGATHKVNPPEPVKNFFPVEMTNHDKMIWRKDQREAKRDTPR